jgi:acyl-CoA synthetase (AMP-forming)/AMP-acid ligase II
MTVPSTASLLLNGFLLRKFSYRTLTHLLLGGARFSAGLYERILANLHPDLALFNLYGPTECAVASHGTRLTRDPKSDIVDGNVTIGRPGPSVECRLMASNREEPTVRRSGELLLGGPQLMNGYLNDPERTAEVIQDVGGCHFYRTGDAAYVDGAGNYYISGRLDETVKRSGYRINLQDIDSYVSRLPCVELCAAVAVDTDELDLRIVMFIVPTSTSVTVTELQRSMRVCLADSQMPDEIIMLSTLPRNVSGKIDRAAILASYARQHARVDAELVRTDSLESA